MTPPPSASKDFVGTWITFMSGSLVLGKRMKTVRIGFSVLVLFGVMFFGITHAEAARFSCCVCRRTGSSVTVCSQSRERDPDNTAAAATAAERCSQVDSAASAFTCFITENTCTATTLCAGLTAAPLGEPAIQFTNCCLLTKAGSPSVCLQSSPYAAGDTDRTRAGDQRCGDLNNSGAEYEGYRNRFYTNERCSHVSECGSGTVRSLGEGEPTVAQVGTLAPRVGATSCVTAGDCLGGQTCVERTCRNASGGGCATDADCNNLVNPEINTAAASSNQLRSAVNILRAKCPSLSDAPRFVTLLYYAHNSGGGSLGDVIRIAGCNATDAEYDAASAKNWEDRVARGTPSSLPPNYNTRMRFARSVAAIAIGYGVTNPIVTGSSCPVH